MPAAEHGDDDRRCSWHCVLMTESPVTPVAWIMSIEIVGRCQNVERRRRNDRYRLRPANSGVGPAYRLCKWRLVPLARLRGKASLDPMRFPQIVLLARDGLATQSVLVPELRRVEEGSHLRGGWRSGHDFVQDQHDVVDVKLVILVDVDSNGGLDSAHCRHSVEQSGSLENPKCHHCV